jgi:thioredoxin reductase (NADPH)
MFTPTELRQAKIFACLDEAECARMAQNAADVRLKAGEWPLREGETPWFYVVFECRLRIVKDILGRQTEFEEYDFKQGDFFGEVPLLLGSPVLASVRAQTPCRVARLVRRRRAP